MIKSYHEALTVFNTARWPDKGKPITNWARMYKLADGSLLVRVYELDMFKFNPDNTFEFVCDRASIRRNCVTLSQALHRHLPFNWMRKSTGVYTVQHINENTYRGPWREIDTKLKAIPKQEVFQGLKFNLTTGECLNPKVPEIETVIPEKRKIWLRKIKAFNKALQVRAKIGVLDRIVEEVQAERNATPRQWQQPDWASDEWLDTWAKVIDTGDIPVSFLKGIAQSTRYGWRNRTTQQQVKETMDTAKQLQRTYSRELRRRFGVFE